MQIEKFSKFIKFKTKFRSFLIKDKTLKIGDLIIDSPGEYEKSGIFVESPKSGVFAINVENNNILYAMAKKVSPELGGADLFLTNNEKLVSGLESKHTILIKDLDKITIKDGVVKKDSK